jgi:hypothetical protein
MRNPHLPVILRYDAGRTVSDTFLITGGAGFIAWHLPERTESENDRAAA